MCVCKSIEDTEAKKQEVYTGVLHKLCLVQAIFSLEGSYITDETREGADFMLTEIRRDITSLAKKSS